MESALKKLLNSEKNKKIVNQPNNQNTNRSKKSSVNVPKIINSARSKSPLSQPDQNSLQKDKKNFKMIKVVSYKDCKDFIDLNKNYKKDPFTKDTQTIKSSSSNEKESKNPEIILDTKEETIVKPDFLEGINKFIQIKSTTNQVNLTQDDKIAQLFQEIESLKKQLEIDMKKNEREREKYERRLSGFETEREKNERQMSGLQMEMGALKKAVFPLLLRQNLEYLVDVCYETDFKDVQTIENIGHLISMIFRKIKTYGQYYNQDEENDFKKKKVSSMQDKTKNLDITAFKTQQNIKSEVDNLINFPHFTEVSYLNKTILLKEKVIINAWRYIYKQQKINTINFLNSFEKIYKNISTKIHNRKFHSLSDFLSINDYNFTDQELNFILVNTHFLEEFKDQVMAD